MVDEQKDKKNKEEKEIKEKPKSKKIFTKKKKIKMFQTL